MFKKFTDINLKIQKPFKYCIVNRFGDYKYLTSKEPNSCDRMKIIKLEDQENQEVFQRSMIDSEGIMEYC